MGTKMIRGIERLLFAGGLMCLALFLWTVGERAWFQWFYLRELSQEIPGETASARYRTAVLRRGPLGRIEIPRAKVSAAILDGVDAGTLDRAVGHVPGTAFPGETGGRVALAAHRDSFFRNLGDLKTGDSIRLEVSRRVREYKVESTQVVKPDRIDVLAPTSDSFLTLITCYPFQFVGNAPERFIVHARLVN